MSGSLTDKVIVLGKINEVILEHFDSLTVYDVSGRLTREIIGVNEWWFERVLKFPNDDTELGVYRKSNAAIEAVMMRFGLGFKL